MPSSQGVATVLFDAAGLVDTNYGTGGVCAADTQSGEVGPTYAALDAQNRLLVSSDDYTIGESLPYRLARITSLGTSDITFNGNNQQPGVPGIAVPVISGSDFYDNLIAAQPLPDGHIFAVGDAGYAATGDGTSDIALLRLNEDSSFDQTFGDAAHPGWSSINIGGTNMSDGIARSIVNDEGSGRVLIAIAAYRFKWPLLRRPDSA